MKLEEYKNKWFSIGTSVNSTDRQKAEEALNSIYRSANLDPPPIKYWEPSPKAGIEKVIQLKQLENSNKSLQVMIYEAFDECIYGQHDAGCLALYDYLINEDNDEVIKSKMSGQVELAKHCGWVWLYKEYAVLTDKPIHMSLDNNDRLHNSNRMAIEYSDGTGLYVWHGINVPEWFITEKSRLTTDYIESETNLELQKAAKEIIEEMNGIC